MKFALLWAGFLTLVVAGPWLLPGYVFGTDWPGPRNLELPTTLDSSTLLQVALAAVGWVVGGELAGKILVLGSLYVAAALAFLAVPAGDFVPRAAAAAVYVVNPFVYGRLHYGQMFLLGAYALLPWILSSLRYFLLAPGLKTSVWLAAAFALVGIFSSHLILAGGLMAVCLYIAHVAAKTQRLDYLKQTAGWGVFAAFLAAVVSAYWLVPLIAGRGSEAGVLAAIGPGDLAAFAAVPDRSLGLVPNLLGLYGFWAENSGRFLSMKVFVPFWPVALGAILALAALAAAAAFQKATRALAPWVAGLLVAGGLALFLEAGVSSPISAGLVQWLDAHLVLYRGMRDAGKWAAVPALVYSQLVGLGAAFLLDRIRIQVRGWPALWAPGVAAGLLLALPLFYGNGLLFGAHGLIRPSAYPAGWYSADRVLASETGPSRALFLPWHEYMSYSFIQNENRVVASPAPTFFSVPVVSSTNPEVPGILPPSDPDQMLIDGLVKRGAGGDWAQTLAAHQIKYVLLAREFDWASYAYLGAQPNLIKVGDYGSIVLYQDALSMPPSR